MTDLAVTLLFAIAAVFLVVELAVMSRSSGLAIWPNGIRCIVVALVAMVIVGCSRGMPPPKPTEDLHATVVGVVGPGGGPPFNLESDGMFPPEAGTARRITNWPADPAFEEQEARVGTLVLGGQQADGTWWYELVGSGGPTQGGCWPLYGGSFDEGDTIRFSSGLRVPKAPNFEIRPSGTGTAEAFPGHRTDSVCLDRTGQAVSFELDIGL
jgi:hypothetical protein